ncbi:unnamed protein product [Brassica rapa]|uniref:Uncharacterized protein n=2 Tax=Brassica TaxID=3705 RepID=A0A8D9FYB8_BRACM|nr:unnamed protein product [Brassica napus]CAG7862545.1 unnamed protein product [Brassica rapa]
MKLVAEKTRNPRRRKQCLRADLASSSKSSNKVDGNREKLDSLSRFFLSLQ